MAPLFQNAGDNQALNLKVADVRFEPHPASRESGTERPGRVHASSGSRRSSVSATDWHAAGEAEFLSSVAAELDGVVRTHKVKHLVVVAPPKALGVLRQSLTPAAKAVVTAEIAKDIARLSNAEIEGHLTTLSELR